MSVSLIHASICTAFDMRTVGTKVPTVRISNFLELAAKLVTKFDFATCKVSGQAFIPADELSGFVSAGVGRRTTDPNDYVLREYRGTVEMFLCRRLAAPVMSCALIVYTREAYLADPDVQKDALEISRINDSIATHVIVAILTSAGPTAPLSPHRLVHNLAGGNNEALAWTADEIRAKAAESAAYHKEWCVVAD